MCLRVNEINRVVNKYVEQGSTFLGGKKKNTKNNLELNQYSAFT